MKKFFLHTLLLIPLVAYAAGDPDVEAGNQALQNGNPEEALKHYEKAEQTLSGNPDLSFNRGGALYAQKKYQEAATSFLAATGTGDATRRAEAYRHYGDSLFRQQDLNGAIQAYEQALTLNPNDEVARHNLEVALSKQQEQPPQSQPNQNQEDQPQSQPQSQNSQSQPSSQNSQGDPQSQPQSQPNQQGSPQEEQNKEQKEEKNQSASSNEEKKDQEKKEAQAQQAQEGQEQKSPEDKLLDALRAKEKSFLRAKKKAKGNGQLPVDKDW